MPPAASSTTPAPAGEVLKVFVISDLHAFDKGLLESAEGMPSYIDVSEPDTNVLTHPIASLKDLIARESITADVLICAGDLCDKAQPSAMSYAWRTVLDLQGELGAAQIATTVGNHDVDSRHQHNDHDAKGHLQALDPSFPSPQIAVSDQFWARHYYVVEGDAYRIVVLNSSAFHGESSPPATPGANPEEFKHGRISLTTLARLKVYLQNAAPKPINILLCHHHPHRHAELKLEDYSEMKGGPELLQLLEQDSHAPWLVVHGHTHHPKISYATGAGANAPIVFSAGSLSARLFPELAARARNQCYLFEFPLASISRFGLVGSFRAWEWNLGTGWAQTSKDSNIPSRGGFGFRTNLPVLATQLNAKLSGRVHWADVIALSPEVEFLAPQDLRNLVKKLEGLGISVSYNEVGEILEFERP